MFALLTSSALLTSLFPAHVYKHMHKEAAVQVETKNGGWTGEERRKYIHTYMHAYTGQQEVCDLDPWQVN